MSTWISVYDALAELRRRAEQHERHQRPHSVAKAVAGVSAAGQLPQGRHGPRQAGVDVHRSNRSPAGRGPGS